MELQGLDVGHLKNLDKNFFELIKLLWAKAADPSQNQLIRDNYGVEKISNGLTFDNAIAVKATASVLLFLSISDAVDDFVNEVFFNNIYVAVGKTYNDTNYILLSRLIRILQCNKGFNDWMFAKGPTPKENKVWRRLYDLSKIESLSEHIRKETSRAVKEGMRVGGKEGQFCIVPRKVVDKMKKEIFWKITDTDINQLDNLVSQTKSRPASPSISFKSKERDEDAELALGYLIRKLDEEKTARLLTEKSVAQLREELDNVLKETAQDKAAMVSASTDHGLKAERTTVLSTLESLTAEVHSITEIDADKDLRNTGVQSSANRVKQQLNSLSYEVSEHARSTLHQMRHSVLGTLRRYKEMGPASIQNLSSSQSMYLSGGPPSLSTSYENLPHSSLGASIAQLPPSADECGPLPIGCEKRIDPRTNRYYFFERLSGRSQWKFPS